MPGQYLGVQVRARVEAILRLKSEPSFRENLPCSTKYPLVTLSNRQGVHWSFASLRMTNMGSRVSTRPSAWREASVRIVFDLGNRGAAAAFRAAPQRGHGVRVRIAGRRSRLLP